MITVASVVEGCGEVTAVPALVRRVAFAHGIFEVRTTLPHRLARGDSAIQWSWAGPSNCRARECPIEAE